MLLSSPCVWIYYWLAPVYGYVTEWPLYMAIFLTGTCVWLCYWVVYVYDYVTQWPLYHIFVLVHYSRINTFESWILCMAMLLSGPCVLVMLLSCPCVWVMLLSGPYVWVMLLSGCCVYIYATEWPLCALCLPVGPCVCLCYWMTPVWAPVFMYVTEWPLCVPMLLNDPCMDPCVYLCYWMTPVYDYVIEWNSNPCVWLSYWVAPLCATQLTSLYHSCTNPWITLLRTPPNTTSQKPLRKTADMSGQDSSIPLIHIILHPQILNHSHTSWTWNQPVIKKWV